MTTLDDQIKSAIQNNIWMVYIQPPTKKCPNCEILENLLTINNIHFESLNIVTPESMTELYFRYCFPSFTPILQKGTHIYHKEIWKVYGKELSIPRIKYIIDPIKSKNNNWIDTEDTLSTCENGVCRI